MNTVKINKKDVKIVAHRGLSGIERENTCPAFVAAANRSYFGIETDVHTTKDGKFVIIHDETTDRVCDGKYKINVEESNYSDVQNIVLPDKDGTYSRQDIRIPLLEEYIKICKKYEKTCVLEVKNPFVKSDMVRMVEGIKSLGYLENVIFISFDLNNCLTLRELLPNHAIQWLLEEEVGEEKIKILKDYRLDLDIYYRLLNKGLIEKLHSLGIKVNCWTCDSREDAERLVGWGVDFITTNILE